MDELFLLGGPETHIGGDLIAAQFHEGLRRVAFREGDPDLVLYVLDFGFSFVDVEAGVQVVEVGDEVSVFAQELGHEIFHFFGREAFLFLLTIFVAFFFIALILDTLVDFDLQHLHLLLSPEAL